ncbi:MAG: TetR/AcrR family transcriptional regulator [Actinobacteria bacterium]|nr:TetR/AcrR family transcriptional regulator [Actinomycetota bacterium]
MALDEIETSRGETSRAKLMKASQEILASEGFKGMSTRAVAERAGVALSLVHHHFGGKRGLLIAALDEDLARVGRYQRLLEQATTLSEAWRILIDESRRDMASGTIRAEWETFIVGLGDPELSDRWQKVTAAWRELYTSVLERLLPALDRESPLPPSALAAILVDFFLGAEAELLAAAASGSEAAPEELDLIDRIGQLIAQFEAGEAR